jgi:hypothetical protein
VHRGKSTRDLEGADRVSLASSAAWTRPEVRFRPRLPILSLEPISKSSEEDNEAAELDKAEEVLSVVLPVDEDSTLPLYPGEEALDEPAPHVTA